MAGTASHTDTYLKVGVAGGLHKSSDSEHRRRDNNNGHEISPSRLRKHCVDSRVAGPTAPPIDGKHDCQWLGLHCRAQPSPRSESQVAVQPGTIPLSAVPWHLRLTRVSCDGQVSCTTIPNAYLGRYSFSTVKPSCSSCLRCM